MDSNDSKNGLTIEACIEIVKKLINECRNLPVTPGNISLAGFSGGAKVALVSANTIQNFTSVIYCGAALPVESINVNIPLLGFAGKKDMNYTEVKNFNRWTDSQIKESGLVEWQGKHEWPDSISFLHAFYWHLINADKKSALRNDTVIKQYTNLINYIVDNETSPIIKAEYLKNEIALLDNLAPVKEIKKRLGFILISPDYKRAIAEQTSLINSEEIKKQELISSFSSRDMNWWINQINLLKKNDSESSQRLLGYISLGSWSYSSKAVDANNFDFAMKVLQIYKLADPENSEQAYLKACLYSKNNNADSAVYFLSEAIKLGLNDRSKIENSKDLALLRGRNDFNNALASIKFEN